MARILAALVITSVCIGITAGSAAELKACTATMHAEAGCSSIIPVRIDKGGQTNLLVLDRRIRRCVFWTQLLWIWCR